MCWLASRDARWHLQSASAAGCSPFKPSLSSLYPKSKQSLASITTAVAIKNKRLVFSYFKASIPNDLNSYQIDHHGNRSAEDAITMALHATLSYLEHPNSYVRTLFVGFRSAFSTIIPQIERALMNSPVGLAVCSASWRAWFVDLLA